MLGKLYDLSPAELRVASALLAGKSPEEYAQQAGVSIKKLFKNLNDRLSCNNFGLGGLAVVLDEFNRRAMAVIMSST
jgi:hypothetical protein